MVVCLFFLLLVCGPSCLLVCFRSCLLVSVVTCFLAGWLAHLGVLTYHTSHVLNPWCCYCRQPMVCVASCALSLHVCVRSFSLSCRFTLSCPHRSLSLSLSAILHIVHRFRVSADPGGVLDGLGGVNLPFSLLPPNPTHQAARRGGRWPAPFSMEGPSACTAWG